MNTADNPIDAMIATLTGAGEDAETAVQCGCPLNNLAQEMSPVDEGFRERVEKLQTLWRRGLARNLARGQREGTVRADLDAADTAAFLVAACEGSIGLAKGSQDPRLLKTCIRGIVQYLETLRPVATPIHVGEARAGEEGLAPTSSPADESVGATPALPSDPIATTAAH